jgi:hypothetical protein
MTTDRPGMNCAINAKGGDISKATVARAAVRSAAVVIAFRAAT